MTQEKLPHRKELCLQSEADADASAFLHFLTKYDTIELHKNPHI